MAPIALAIHGGCGVMTKDDMSESAWQAARADLGRSLKAGWQVLSAGGSALDAVEAAVVVMEDSPHFNSGHGAALNENAEHELDASIMNGETLESGAICLARRTRNPIKVARAVMESGDVVMLGGAAADAFAEKNGLDVVDPSYFTTEQRVQALAKMKAHAEAGTYKSATEAEKHGTVGAVALDGEGHLAAATSTGGYNNKPAGRIGDSPVIGAGTYARDGVCAFSGTGQGEYFIRLVVGHELASRVAYRGDTLQQAIDDLMKRDLNAYGIGAGGVAIAADGSVAMSHNTKGMFRGWVTPEGKIFVASHDEIYEFEG